MAPVPTPIRFKPKTAGWRTRDVDLSFALVDGMHRLTDAVASRNSILGTEQSDWQLQLSISGLEGARDYERCLAYLQGISLVERVAVEAADPGRVRFSLDLNAQPRHLLETFIRDRVLAQGLADDVLEMTQDWLLDVT